MSLPTFPRFQKLQFEHKKVVESYTKRYQPYSDFNFISLYCWNIDGNTELSQLNGNLVIRMKDYHGKRKIYSYFGTNSPEHTIQTLFNTKAVRIQKLTFVPKVNLQKDKRMKELFDIRLDRNHFDYIFSCEELSKYEGSKYHNKRNLAKRFEQQVNTEFVEIDLSDIHIQKQIIRLNTVWTKLKDAVNEQEYIDELAAIKRFFEFAHHPNVKAFGLYEDKRLITFIFVELLPKKFALVHFKKCNLTYTGIAEFAMKELSLWLFSHGYLYMNFEQDLGVQGLRNAKMSNRPIRFLKKYGIKKKDSSI